MEGRRAILCGIVCLVCIAGVHAGSNGRSLLEVKKPPVAVTPQGTSTICGSGTAYQSSCKTWYTNIGAGIRFTPLGAAANNVAQALYGADATLTNLVDVLFPVATPQSGANTGAFLVKNRISQVLYGADATLTNLVNAIFPSTAAPGTPGTAAGNAITKPIIGNSNEFDVTANCPASKLLVGGSVKVVCTKQLDPTATPPSNVLNFPELAAAIGSITEKGIQIGVGTVGKVYGNFGYQDATFAEALTATGLCSEAPAVCACNLVATPICNV